ncbi:MAG: hypothetical protein ACR2P5_09920 [Gammaproteobacteria bacterium]
MKNVGKIICISALYGIGIASILGSGAPAPTVRTFTYWGKNGFTYDDARTYHAQCKYEVGIQKFESRAERDELINACMEKEGFRQIQYAE